MRAEIAAAAAVVLVSIGAARQFENAASAAAETDASPPRLAAAAPARLSEPYGGFVDEVRVPAARDQQFYVTAAVNNAPAPFLVDTGAGFVALRESDARAAGIHTAWTDFTHPVRTANGETKAALVYVDAIEIGPLRVENVKAFVLADEQLGINLLGMSFLSRLDSVEARGGELVLRG